jgi:hypothetical protein
MLDRLDDWNGRTTLGSLMVIEALHQPQRCVRLRLAVTLVAGSALLLALLARYTSA